MNESFSFFVSIFECWILKKMIDAVSRDYFCEVFKTLTVQLWVFYHYFDIQKPEKIRRSLRH